MNGTLYIEHIIHVLADLLFSSPESRTFATNWAEQYQNETSDHLSHNLNVVLSGSFLSWDTDFTNYMLALRSVVLPLKLALSKDISLVPPELLRVALAKGMVDSGETIEHSLFMVS